MSDFETFLEDNYESFPSDCIKIEEFINKTFTVVKRMVIGSRHPADCIYFRTTNGEEYLMYHDQDCCEEVNIEDINGDLNDLVGGEILKAYSTSNKPENPTKDDSETWTFYHLSTIKGSVVIRWCGSSNGYYSEDVSLVKLTLKFVEGEFTDVTNIKLLS